MTRRTPVRTALRVLLGPYKAVRSLVVDIVHDWRSIKMEKEIARESAAADQLQERERERAFERSVRLSLMAQIEPLLDDCVTKMRLANYPEGHQLHLDFHRVYDFLYLTQDGKVMNRDKKLIFVPMMTNESLTRFKAMLLEAIHHLDERIAHIEAQRKAEEAQQRALEAEGEDIVEEATQIARDAATSG